MIIEFAEVETKELAIPLVSASMSSRRVLLDPEFQAAMDLSLRFDITAQDILTYRRARAARNAVDARSTEPLNPARHSS